VQASVPESNSVHCFWRASSGSRCQFEKVVLGLGALRLADWGLPPDDRESACNTVNLNLITYTAGGNDCDERPILSTILVNTSCAQVEYNANIYLAPVIKADSVMSF
jgi:hypothetical protein